MTFIPCDSSGFGFVLRRDGRELVARLYYGQEPLGPEFRDTHEDALRLAIAEWLLRLTVDARSMQ